MPGGRIKGGCSISNGILKNEIKKLEKNQLFQGTGGTNRLIRIKEFGKQ